MAEGALVASFASDHGVVRGFGAAWVVEIPAPWVDHVSAVTALLQSLTHNAPDGSAAVGGNGPIAFCALPFDRSEPARVIVPEVVERTAADGAVSTRRSHPHPEPQPRLEHLVESFGDISLHFLPESLTEHGAVSACPDSTQVTIVTDVHPEVWCDAVRSATERIHGGELRKVVLARELVVHADAPFDPHAIAARLATSHPHALRFDIDGFVGASPELLVSRFGDIVRSHPMAGTTPRTGDRNVDDAAAADLLHSPKNREEHQITIDMVLDTLLEFTSFVDAEPEPSIVAAGSVQHLATLVEGHLSTPAASVLELVAALHPTPAVGGFPRHAALSLIAEFEPAGRGRYAGPVGWVDADGNGEFAVGLRSASIEGNTARLFAGVGVVEDSDPLSELEETRSKFAATLGAFTRL